MLTKIRKVFAVVRTFGLGAFVVLFHNNTGNPVNVFYGAMIGLCLVSMWWEYCHDWKSAEGLLIAATIIGCVVHFIYIVSLMMCDIHGWMIAWTFANLFMSLGLLVLEGIMLYFTPAPFPFSEKVEKIEAAEPALAA